MKVYFSILIPLFLIAFHLHGLDFPEKKNGVPYLSKGEEKRLSFYHPLAVLQERLHFLKSYHPKIKDPLLKLRKRAKSSSFSIVEAKWQISDFEARFELANTLSHHLEGQREALEHYAILLREKPQHRKIWLEIGRLYVAQGKFVEASHILAALVYKYPLRLDALFSSFATEQKKELRQSPQSLIDLASFIGDDQARLELARILSKQEKNLEEAIQLYQLLLHKKPHDEQLVLAISRLYIRQKKYQLALLYLYPAIEEHSCNPDLLVEAARAELNLGHAKQSHTLLVKALPLSRHPESILREDASVFMLVGDFYKAEAIYRQALECDPHSLDLALTLAWTLVSAQRYEEAEGIYKTLLLKHPCHPKILEALVTLKMLEKDFSSALDTIDTLMSLFPQDPSYLSLKAEALYKSENYIEALEEFERLSTYSKFYGQALIGKGRVSMKLGQWAESREFFQEAYVYDPSFIQAQFYQAGEEVSQKWFIQQVANQTKEPKDLIEWANVYADNGMGGIIEFYEAALAIDPDYFPAQTGLAEAFSTHYKYDEAIEIYLSILDSFPENSKIMIAVARVLSWGKNYANSMEWYERVIALNPQDPVPVREMARVAYWGKFFHASMAIYHSLLKPAVDCLLLQALWELREESTLSFSLEWLSQSVENGSIYKGYEAIASQSAELYACDETSEKSQVEALLIRYLPLYRIQKSIKLESEAKYFDWENKPLHALPVYQELADFSPGNEEGLYGYAQDFCNLGLCKRSRYLYKHILNLTPTNNLVKMVLERNLLQEHPLIQSNYTYWRERGSGQFSNSQITRQQLDEIYQWSPSCNQHFRFIQREWLEYPFLKQKYYLAEGQSLEVDHVFNGYIRGAASATCKKYFQKFPTRYTCLGNLWFNLYDYVNLGIGFERRNEIYNYFTLKQGIQAKVYWISLQANTHSWVTEATYNHLDYNDRNSLDHVHLLVSYAFTEDPEVFKVILNGNYRNTAHLTQIITSPLGELITIIHPYWTPQHYYSGSVTLQFRYNYAWFTYCEAPQRYVDIKLTGEDDTSHNPSIQLAINWKHEFMRHWGFEITGLYHRSKLWNADGIWTQVYYRF